MHCNFRFTFFVFFLAVAGGCTQQHYTDALSPEEALMTFHLNEDFEIELYASEPFVQDPVSMIFDEQGNIYVVEMPDYPFAPEPGKEQGKIKVLKDTNNDGRVDKAIIFAEGLSEATTLLPWKGGLLVTAAPDILYLKDTTGDDKADIKETLFKGFFKGNSEAQITALRYSIDNWIYAANMGFESYVRKEGYPGTDSLSLVGTDFRFRMDKDLYEPVAGTAQFGQAINDIGHRFVTENSLHIRQVVIPWKYLRRNPYLSLSKSTADISDHQQDIFQITPPPYWRLERTRRRNEQYQKEHLNRVEYADKHFSGASGSTFYTGDKFPPDFYGNHFVVDVASGIVHRDILSRPDTSVLYTASVKGYEKSHEFIASTDPWFRPVNVCVGPDGYLYVIDMYRQHIETPFAIPEDLKADMDFMNGAELGRIYRVVPKKSVSAAPVPDTRNFSTKDWVSLLQHPNQIWRLHAQRRLIEIQDVSAGKELMTIFKNNDDYRIRLHALFTLEGLGLINEKLIFAALADKAPGIREVGLGLGEQYPLLSSRIVEGIRDTVAGVSFQAILSAGGLPAGKTMESMIWAVNKYSESKWFRKAVLCSNAGSSPEFIVWLGRKSGFFQSEGEGRLSFIQEYAAMVTARNGAHEIVDLLNFFIGSELNNKESWIRAAMTGIDQAMVDTGNKLQDNEVLKAVQQIEESFPSKETKLLASSVKKHFSAAEQ